MEGVRAFSADMTSHCGKGIYRYQETGTYEEQECKARRNGYHFVTYPPDCLEWYPWGKGNRYFLIDAQDVNEDEKGIASCKKMELKKELTPLQFVILTIKYMVLNPKLDYEAARTGFSVRADKASVEGEGVVAIARGKNPIVKGTKGSILGLVKEKDGEIIAAKAFIAQSDRWHMITDDCEVVEV